MSIFSVEIPVRWSDVDANNHVRHSAYYDYGAHVRIRYFNAHGITSRWLAEHHIGPILFSEHCLFHREISLNDTVNTALQASGLSLSADRWHLVHTITRSDGVKAATITVQGAWIDTEKRRVTMPPQKAIDMMHACAKTDDFVEIIRPS